MEVRCGKDEWVQLNLMVRASVAKGYKRVKMHVNLTSSDLVKLMLQRSFNEECRQESEVTMAQLKRVRKP